MMNKKILLFLSISISWFIFNSSFAADEMDPWNEYESSSEFEEAYNCLQTDMNVDIKTLVEVEKCTRKALKIVESSTNIDPKKIAEVHFTYGLLLSKKGASERNNSLEALTRAYYLTDAAFGSDSCETAAVLFELASQKSHKKSLLNSAFYDYKRSLSTCVPEKNKNHATKIISFLQSFQLEKLNKKQLASAKLFSKQAYDIFFWFEGPSHNKTRSAALELGQLYFLTGEYQQSIEILERAFPTWNVTQMGGNPKTLDILFSYLAESHEKLGNLRESGRYRALMRAKELPVDFKLDSKIVDPDLVPVFIKPPVYPKIAQRLGKHGYAVVELTVLPSGKVRDPILLEERPEKLFFGKAAMRVAKDLRYSENLERPEQKSLYKYTFQMRKNR